MVRGSGLVSSGIKVEHLKMAVPLYVAFLSLSTFFGQIQSTGSQDLASRQHLLDVNITCDNRLWFYADDQVIVDENTPGQGDVLVTKHVSVPADTKVYGIKCENFHLVGGILASFGDGRTTDGTWKCTSLTPGDDWLSADYDDSLWQPAEVLHTNNQPSDHWDVRPDISASAQWIWTEDWEEEDRTVYCRKESKVDIEVNITCDNTVWLYADEQTAIDENTKDQDQWPVTKHVSVPADTKVYGIKCEDAGVVAGIIASFSDGTITNGTWKCTNTAPEANWLSETYNDSSWQSAYVIHTNNETSPFWGTMWGISSTAQWIWTENWIEGDPTVYCSKVIKRTSLPTNRAGCSHDRTERGALLCFVMFLVLYQVVHKLFIDLD